MNILNVITIKQRITHQNEDPHPSWFAADTIHFLNGSSEQSRERA